MTAFQESLNLGLANERRTASLGANVAVIDGLPYVVPAREPKGVVYTKRRIVDLILDLAGYRPDQDLAERHVVEPTHEPSSL